MTAGTGDGQGGGVRASDDGRRGGGAGEGSGGLVDGRFRPAVPIEAPTETRNPRTLDIDTRSSLDILRLLNEEDALVPAAVAAVLPALAPVVDVAEASVRAGGRIHYFGAGTSGRLGALDAAELPPTFGVDATLVSAHNAGGKDALFLADEGAEDDEAAGAAAAAGVAASDVAIGLAASGRTPYVLGALRAARAAGATTVLVSANPDAPFAAEVDAHIGVATGPEAIAGSTRLKAGTAEKLILNGFSTALMVRLGLTWSNLMVGMTARNSKLRGRLLATLVDATGESEERCASALVAAGGDGRVALVALLGGVDTPTAEAALRAGRWTVRAALAQLADGAAADPVSERKAGAAGHAEGGGLSGGRVDDGRA
jgi:N-acetylmuramic acid 6-phosphate etherase